MDSTLLTEDEIAELLNQHSGWHRDGQRLRRSFEFVNFVEAFAFMSKVALISEKLFHHPEWCNVYNRVDIAITDHGAGGLSSKDKRWVEVVDQIALG